MLLTGWPLIRRPCSVSRRMVLIFQGRRFVAVNAGLRNPAHCCGLLLAMPSPTNQSTRRLRSGSIWKFCGEWLRVLVAEVAGVSRRLLSQRWRLPDRSRKRIGGSGAKQLSAKVLEKFVTVTTPAFERIIGTDLSAVTFVRDYLQLQFSSDAILNAMTHVLVSVNDVSVSIGERGFADLMVGQIDKIVQDVIHDENVSLQIIFDDRSLVSVSLKPDDYVGAEAIHLIGDDGSWLVI